MLYSLILNFWSSCLCCPGSEIHGIHLVSNTWSLRYIDCSKSISLAQPGHESFPSGLELRIVEKHSESHWGCGPIDSLLGCPKFLLCHYGGLNQMSSIHLVHLNSWSPVSWRVLGGVALMKKVCHCGWGLRFQKMPAIFRVLFASCLNFKKGILSSCPNQNACCPAAPLAHWPEMMDS